MSICLLHNYLQPCPACTGQAKADHAAPSASRYSAWLIECQIGGPLWFSGVFRREGRRMLANFVTDASKAVRYPTQAAAQAAFDMLDDMAPCSILGRSCYTITEHEWSGAVSERGALPKRRWSVTFSENGEEYLGSLTVEAHSLERDPVNDKAFFVDGVWIEIDEYIVSVEELPAERDRS